jgi:hypothetical protein
MRPAHSAKCCIQTRAIGSRGEIEREGLVFANFLSFLVVVAQSIQLIPGSPMMMSNPVPMQQGPPQMRPSYSMSVVSDQSMRSASPNAAHFQMMQQQQGSFRQVSDSNLQPHAT